MCGKARLAPLSLSVPHHNPVRWVLSTSLLCRRGNGGQSAALWRQGLGLLSSQWRLEILAEWPACQRHLTNIHWVKWTHEHSSEAVAPGPDPGLLVPDPMSFPSYPHIFKVTKSKVMGGGAALDTRTSGLWTEEFGVRELHDHICAAEDETQQDLDSLV